MYTRTMAAALALGLLAGGAQAESFRWSSKGDAATLDPHGLAEGLTLGFLGNVYEGLLRRGRDLALEPALATRWESTGADVWRFTLRAGVTFHDGRPFTAEDVKFSFERASAEGSGIRSMVGSIRAVKVVDDLTVDVVTNGPAPILPEEISNWLIMSASWAAENKATDAASVRRDVQNHATTHANGTGPFRITAREQDVRTELAANGAWWDTPEHNLTRATVSPITADATRVAALLSGETDMVYPVPVQDMDRIVKTPGVKLLSGPELRTIFLGMDVSRDELIYSDVKGRNPLKDVRVRKALYQAIDVDAVNSKLMRGQATPTGLMIGPGINGFDPALNDRYAYDPAAARDGLAAAGYGDGFELGLDCPNNRYVNDEAICKAVVSMLAKVGVRVRLNAMPKAQYFKKLRNLDTSFYLLGWTSGTYDAHHPLRFLMSTPNKEKRLGSWNFGGYSDARTDALVAAIGRELDPARRQAMINEAFTIHKRAVGHIPLHQQSLAWGAKEKVDLVQRADNFFNLRWVVVN